MNSRAEPLDVLVVGEGRLALAQSLEEDGLVVAARPGIFPALELLRHRAARVVILGHEEVEGRSANPIEEIRALGSALRVVLLHPEALPPDDDQIVSLGADQSLSEPIFPQKLLRCVRDLVTHGTNGGESAPAAPATAEVLRQIHRSARDLPVLKAILVQHLGRLTGATRTSLMLHRPASRELFLAEYAGLPATVARGHRVKVGHGIAGRVAERARPVAVPDIDRSEFHLEARHEGYATGSFLSVPLVADARVLGVLSFSDRHDGTPYTAADLDAILPVVDTAAAVIRNAVLIRRLRAASMLDHLTSLMNRRYFDRALQRELKRARRYTHPLSLVLIDVDRFKRINDAEGHSAGDETLRALSDILRDVFRETDVICRHGGDEFAVLMPETPRDRAEQAVKRLTEALGRTPIPGEEHVPGGKLGVSCGLATYPEDTSKPEDIVAFADGELYGTKDRHHEADGANEADEADEADGE